MIDTSTFPPPKINVPITLSPGDTIEIKFKYWPELDEVQEIRPDGKISLQMVGDVSVSGLTPEALTNQLTLMYTGKIKEPEIAVIVRTLVNNVVYVGGEVKNPQMIPYKTTLSLLDAVISAGGFNNRSAHIENVIVLRHAEGKRYAAIVNMSQRFDNETTEPFQLSPRDIVYVPRTKVDKANQWIAQYISEMIPDVPVYWMWRIDSRNTAGYSQ